MKIPYLLLLALLLTQVSTKDTLCNRSGKVWNSLVLNKGDSYSFSTEGSTYKNWMKCHTLYKMGTCDVAVINCDVFNTIASKEKCFWGDYLAIADSQGFQRFCRNNGPKNLKRTKDFKLRFISNGKKTSRGVSCTVECPPMKVDCELDQWTTWSTCSQTCGGGTQSRNRTIIKEPSNGGAPCSDTQQTQECNSNPCPVNCELAQWTEWTVCTVTCGGGSQDRSRAIITEASNGGTPCSDTEETRVCNSNGCPVDCELSEWTMWTVCTVSCGGGSQDRSRYIITPASNNGTACGETQQTQDCNQNSCPPVDCVMSDWSAWSSCVKADTCTQSSTRTVTVQPAPGGAACGDLSRTQFCVPEDLKNCDGWESDTGLPGNCYLYLDDKARNWYDAKDECRSKCGDLVSVHSHDEFTFTFGLVDHYSWIGLNALDSSGKNWTWSDGTATDYMFWGSNQPNGDSTKDQCGFYFVDGDYDYSYNDGFYDSGCTDKTFAVCKKDIQ